MRKEMIFQNGKEWESMKSLKFTVQYSVQFSSFITIFWFILPVHRANHRRKN